MTEKLKACPFCGGDELNVHHNDAGWWIDCEGDECAFNKVSRIRKDAVTIWNARTRHTETAVGGDALREALEALEMMYDAWENGAPCFENDGGNQGSFIGNAFELTADEEQKVLKLIPKERTTPSQPSPIGDEKMKADCDAYLKDLEHGRMPHMASFDHPPVWTNPDTAQAWEMAQQVLMRCSLTPIEVDNIRVVHAYIKSALQQPDKAVPGDENMTDWWVTKYNAVVKEQTKTLNVLKGLRDALKKIAPEQIHPDVEVLILTQLTALDALIGEG